MNMNLKAAETAPEMRLKMHRTCTKSWGDFHQKLHQEEAAPESSRECTGSDLEYRKKRQHRRPGVCGI
jgi:hypothetical protein